jgi:hypothetical protein
MQDGWFAGLPYFLQDLRPQGFLGRHFARTHAASLQVPVDPGHWSDDDVLHAMSHLGADLPGDLIVGEAARRLWQLQRQQGDAPEVSPITERDIPLAYPALATQAMTSGAAGALVGGELPKFTALRHVSDASPAGAEPLRHVLVKFSGGDESAATQRWADLLVCEHLAAESLRELLSVRASTTRIHRAGGRTFLEVERFDRHGRFGRSGVVSWRSADGDLVGAGGRPWPVAVRPLVDQGWLSPDDAQAVLRRWWFGRLIANSDMHDGNLAFEQAATPGAPALRLAPAYDMLPMLYAPLHGVELAEVTWTPALPPPVEREAWEFAARGALGFWQRAAGDPRISDGFRGLCAENAARISTAWAAIGA